MYLVRYCISQVFISCPPWPTSHPLLLTPPPYNSSAAASANLALARSRPSCFKNLLETQAPDLRTISSQRSRIVRITVYCATVLFLFRTYDTIY